MFLKVKELPHKIEVCSTALVQKVSGEMVILDTQNGQYYTLNSVAADMLSYLQNGLSVKKTVEAICCEYEVSEQEVERDIAEMLSTLLDKQLIHVVE